MLSNQALIEKAYAGFNKREVDAVLSVMHPDIRWPKAFKGGYVTGHEAVRVYWTSHWSEIDPKVEPISLTVRPDGKVEVQVDQLVKDLTGQILFDSQVKHVYVISGGLLQQMGIE